MRQMPRRSCDILVNPRFSSPTPSRPIKDIETSKRPTTKQCYALITVVRSPSQTLNNSVKAKVNGIRGVELTQDLDFDFRTCDLRHGPEGKGEGFPAGTRIQLRGYFGRGPHCRMPSISIEATKYTETVRSNAHTRSRLLSIHDSCFHDISSSKLNVSPPSVSMGPRSSSVAV